MELIVSVPVSVSVVPGADDVDRDVDGDVDGDDDEDTEEALFDTEVILKKLLAPESSEKR